MGDSAIESEYIAASDATKKGVWFKKFIASLDVVPSITNPLDLYYDNNGALLKPKSPYHIKETHT